MNVDRVNDAETLQNNIADVQPALEGEHLEECEHRIADTVEVESSRICPHTRNQNDRHRIVRLLAQFHVRNVQALAKQADAFVSVVDLRVVATRQLAAEHVHTVTGEGEHQEHDQHGHQQNLFETSTELVDHPEVGKVRLEEAILDTNGIR